MISDPLNELAIQEFRSFLVAFEKQSYAEAARELDLAVPTVWGQVQHLEKQYQIALFERSGRGIVATDAGRRLYEHANSFLAKLDLSKDAVRDAIPLPRTLTILTGVRMMLEDLGPILKEFHAKWPAVTLRILHGDNRKAEQLLMSGEADLAMAVDPGPALRSETIHVERAYKIDHLAAVPQDHPLAKKSKISLRDLIRHRLILGSQETYTRMLFEQALHREELSAQLELAVETDNSAYTYACVKAGLGVGVLAGRSDSELAQGLSLISLEKILGTAWIVFLWRKGKSLSPIEESFVNLVRQKLKVSKRESQ
jgi:DNA-binding transcriptional LysR family regulator